MTERTRLFLSPPLLAAVIATIGSHSAAAQARVLRAEDYLQPPQAIRNVLESDAMRRQESLSNLQPDGSHFLLSRREALVPLERLSRPYVNLGETPIDHRANRGRRLSTGTTTGYELHDIKSGKRHAVSTPADATVSNASWSPDGKHIAYFAHFDDASYLYVANVASGESRRVCDRPLALTLVSSFQWSWSGKQILVTLVPNDRGEMPERQQTPQEPSVWVSHDGKTPSRTYRFLLKNPHDARLLEWLATTQLALVDVEGGGITEIGKPAMFRSMRMMPDAKHFRVSTMQKPFSYFVPARSFGSKDELWDRKGKVVKLYSERKLQISRSQSSQRRQTPGAGRTRGGSSSSNRGGSNASRAAPKRSVAIRPDGKGMSFLQLAPLPKPKAKPKDKGGAKKGDKSAGAASKTAKAAPVKPVKKVTLQKPAASAAKKTNADAVATATTSAPRRGDMDARRARMRRRMQARGDGGGGQGGRRSRGASRGPRSARAQGARGTASSASAPQSKAAKRKDRVMLWKAPYGDKDVEVVWTSDEPIQSVQYSKDCKRIYVTQRKGEKTVVFAVDLAKPKVRIPLYDYKGSRAPQPSMANIPARFRARMRGRMGGGSRSPRLMAKSRGGASYVRTSTDGKALFLSGSEAPKDPSKETARSWIDRLDIGTRKRSRVWQAAKGPFAERLLTILDDDMKQLMVSRESETMIANSYLVDTKTKAVKRITDSRDPAPAVTAAKRMRIKIKRVDGFEFWCRVTIPTGYGERLPALFWFYPREFTDQKSYDDRAKRGVRPHRFPMVRTRSMELLTMLGYVVVQPDCPIVGPQGRPNDNYIPDLRNSLWATIDELDKRRIIDRDRLAIGGHSYGAFSTANAMIHTPFFKAGIAGDGNYNRTLTPMSFQAERRYLWDARETYTRMSPLLWANQLQGAMLMYHGMDDNNTGTFPINSPRMFQALDRLGKKTALYQYPFEGHSPISRESVHDLWARWCEWLDTHVKHHGQKRAPATVEPKADITERR